MKINLNGFQNSKDIDSSESSSFGVFKSDINNNNACIFTDGEKFLNAGNDEQTIFPYRKVTEIEDEKNENIISNYKTAKAKADPNLLSTQAQTQLYTLEESNKLAVQYMNNLQKDFGLTKKQAAGITGNLWHESAGLNSGINQGGIVGEPDSNMADDNEHGYGIAQWGGVRKQGLLDYANQNGIPASSDAANYGYLKQELKGKYNYVIKAIKNTHSTYAATVTFEQLFEHATEPNMDSRLSLVGKLMEMQSVR